MTSGRGIRDYDVEVGGEVGEVRIQRILVTPQEHEVGVLVVE
jgi:hypothetical protein